MCCTVKQFLVSKSIFVVQHPPYSPYLAQADFFLIQKMRRTLKAESFSDISDIQSGKIRQLKGVSLQDFQRAFEELYKRSQPFMDLGVRLYLKSVIKTFKYIHGVFVITQSFI
jgi:hypothetical protein